MESVEEGYNEGALEDVIGKTVYSTAAFGYTFFPKTFEASYHSLLRQMLEAMDSDSERIAVFAPRGMGKTSWALYGYCARNLVNGLAKFLVYLSSSSTSAVRGTDNLKNALIGNKELQEVYGPMKPGVLPLDEGSIGTFSASAWALANGSFVVPRGAGQQVRGLQVYLNGSVYRPDIILIDDLENSEEIQSAEQRLKLRTWFFGDLLKIENMYNKATKIIYIDTLKHEDSIGTYLQKDPSWKVVVLSACDENFNSYAPEYMTTSKLRATYQSHVDHGVEDVFYREYMNIAISVKKRAFKPENFRYYFELDNCKVGTVNPEVVLALKERMLAGTLTKEDKELFRDQLFTLAYNGVPPSKMYIAGKLVTTYNIIIVDPAKTQNIASADTAIILISVTELGFLFVRQIVCGKFTPLQIYENIATLCYTLPVYRIAIEVTGIESFIVHPLKDFLKAIQMPALANTLVELKAVKTKKNERISWLVPLYERHMIYHNLACYEILEGQLKSFPAAKLVDVMDCLAWIVHLLGELEFSFNTSTSTKYDLPPESENQIDWNIYEAEGGFDVY